MKTIKVKTYSLVDKKRMWGTPPLLKNMGKPLPFVKKSDKKLSYKKAKNKYSLKPYGDADKDGYLNRNDCKPLDPKKHGVLKKYKDRPVFFYDTTEYGVKPGEVTQSMVFEKLERKLPDHFGEEEGQEGGRFSDSLTEALVKIKEPEETVARKVVGVHELEKPGSVSHETVFATKHLWEFLKSGHKDKMFKFDIFNPNEIVYVDEEGEKKVNISKALTLPPTGISTSIRQPLTVKRKLSFAEKYATQSAESIIKNFERTTGRRITNKEKQKMIEDLRSEMLSQEDISGITASYSYEPHWSISDLPKHFVSRKDIKVHITDDPAEVVMKSMYSGMHSCEAIDNYEWYPTGAFSDVKHRHPIAYFYLGGKQPYGKDTPSGRVMMRRGHPVNLKGEMDESKEYLGVEPTVYGMGGSSEKNWYPFLLQEFLKKKGVWKVPIRTKHAHSGYADYVANNSRRDVYRYLLGYYREKIEKEYKRGQISENQYKTYMKDDDAVLDNYRGEVSGIPEVYPEDYKKPPESDKPPTFKESEQFLVGKEKIPRSFFHNLLGSSSEDIRYQAILRPEMETKAQKEKVKKLKDRLKTSDFTEEELKHAEERIKSEEKELKRLKEIEPQPFHKMSFDPSLRVKQKVAAYPRLEKRTVESMLPLKEYDITNTLFYNPSLSYLQRKDIGKREGITFDIHGIDKSTDPRVAIEAFKVIKQKNPSALSGVISRTPNLKLLTHIYDKYPEYKKEVIINPETPDYIIERAISDISTSKSSSANRTQDILDVLSRSRLQPDIVRKIYRMYGSNPQVAQKLFTDSKTPLSIKEKIGDRLFKEGYEKLLDNVISYPETIDISTIYKMIDKLSNGKLKTLLSNLINRRGLSQKEKEEILSRVLKRITKSDKTLEDSFLSILDTSRNVDTENYILKEIGIERYAYTDELRKKLIRYLMTSTNKTITDELIRRYG